MPPSTPLSFCTTPAGQLFIASGLSRVQKWDGFSTDFEHVGVESPVNVPYLTGSGTGGILGTYFAYQRFLDREGNPSSLSPVSQRFTPVSDAGPSGATVNVSATAAATAQTVKIGAFNVAIEAGTINITTAAHGLPVNTFQYIKTASIGGTTEANGTWEAIVLSTTVVNIAVKFVNAWTSGGTLRALGTAITAASNAAPIVITSASHGLSDGAIVKVYNVAGNDAANGTWTVNVLTSNTFELNNSEGNGDYTGSGLWITGVSTLTYSNLDVPTDTQVVTRQILRNLDGATNTFYVDVESTDLSATTFASTTVDADLRNNEAVPLFDFQTRDLTSGLSAASGDLAISRYDLPPDFKPFIASQNGRVFALGEVAHEEGNVQVTNGSATVTGINTTFYDALIGRYLHVVGATQPYLISAVPTSTTLTLSEAYADTTTKWGVYKILPPATERRIASYSEAGLPNAWPPTNGVEIPDDGDDFTGAMAMGSFIFVLEKNNIWRWMFDTDPAGLDAAPFHAVARGCLNNRCWVMVSGTGYMMDANGFHSFDGVESKNISPFSSFFHGEGEHVINWRRTKRFHSSRFMSDEVLRWYVCLDGSRYPRHAMCYHYGFDKWWVEEYPWEIGASVGWPAPSRPGGQLTGIEFAGVKAMQEQDYDGVTSGTVRGTATSATLTTLVDTTATFGTVTNAPLSIVSGTGKGQTRRIVSVSGTTLTIKTPWTILPDTTSVYQVGGIAYEWKSGWFRFVPGEQEMVRNIETCFQPTTLACISNQRVYLDFSGTAIVSGVTIESESNNEVGITEGESDFVIDMVRERENSHGDIIVNSGIVQTRLDGHKEWYVDGHRFMQVGYAGVTNGDVRFFALGIEGVKQ